MLRRNAFTLIELLIVITIIGILLALIIAYLSGAFGVGAATRTAVEIGSLEAAVKKFHADHGFYPPQKFVICRNFQRVQSLDAASARFWTKMYPNMTMVGSNTSNPVPGSDWANVQTSMVPSLPGGFPSQPVVTLSGDQCLVFFLSGFQGMGLSPNPRDPTDFSNGLTGKKYFDFERQRLFDIKVSGISFPGYLDPHGTRYVYFSEEGQVNVQQWDAGTAPIQPYFKQTGATRDYFKKFQIISAGADKQFGPGGAYDPNNPVVSSAGYDDIANFRGKKMGVP
jgi:prepilin-type N-terminal cleavage/methylation domain-containing protein